MTACDEKSAINCLSQFEWKLDRSVDEFFQNQDKYIVHEPADFKKLSLIFEKYKRKYTRQIMLYSTIVNLFNYHFPVRNFTRERGRQDDGHRDY